MSHAYLVAGVRTPIGRYGGSLSSVRPDDMGAHAIKELLKKLPSVPREAVDEVIFGCANQAGEDNRNVARMCTLLADLPTSVPARPSTGCAVPDLTPSAARRGPSGRARSSSRSRVESSR